MANINVVMKILDAFYAHIIYPSMIYAQVYFRHVINWPNITIISSTITIK